jgi:hypothetical protein
MFIRDRVLTLVLRMLPLILYSPVLMDNLVLPSTALDPLVPSVAISAFGTVIAPLIPPTVPDPGVENAPIDPLLPPGGVTSSSAEVKFSQQIVGNWFAQGKKQDIPGGKDKLVVMQESFNPEIIYADEGNFKYILCTIW